jgi:hypothetical protein
LVSGRHLGPERLNVRALEDRAPDDKLEQLSNRAALPIGGVGGSLADSGYEHKCRVALQRSAAGVLESKKLPVVTLQCELRAVLGLPSEQVLVDLRAAGGVRHVRIGYVRFLQGLVGRSLRGRAGLRADLGEVRILQDRAIVAATRGTIVEDAGHYEPAFADPALEEFEFLFGEIAEGELDFDRLRLVPAKKVVGVELSRS